jgi:hypothetical protein
MVGLNEDIARDQNNQEVRLAKAFYLFKLNSSYYQREILAELDASLALEPNVAMEHSKKVISSCEKETKQVH